MGENITSLVAKAFKNYSNAAFQRRLNTPDLFSETPFVYYHNYRCRATNGTILRAGETVAIVLVKNHLQVWLESHAIGEIDGDDAVELSAALQGDKRAGNCLLARIEDEVGADGRFPIMLINQGTSNVTDRQTIQ